ncbi:MAG TPA: zf-TFIIB domain-containing protein [Leptospiraceae bacterium]|nr:zf-TFIIB domain-containing protein [Leptospiraceae bacterium]HMW08496.1 zf-TFIIB domain-containing protein [Leptospiraceae bacterium]HMX33336.1 zf-TFIIB domain-containing protein [Leptospiraceae bacterium]HMY34081.1 zf-TFIIB domain-containing protein [Leptospiraceae bacterium]HMZ64598.1 zf-TFIIB domain-containing protein [Leptospiraceae bacterium]
MKCPTCEVKLEKVKTEYGMVAMCQSCFGHFILEKEILRSIQKEKWNQLLNVNKNPNQFKRLTCPSCKNKLDIHILSKEQNSIRIDRCSNCQVIWLEKDKIEDLNLKKPQSKSSLEANTEELDSKAKMLLTNIKLEEAHKKVKKRKEINQSEEEDSLLSDVADVLIDGMSQIDYS